MSAYENLYVNLFQVTQVHHETTMRAIEKEYVKTCLELIRTQLKQTLILNYDMLNGFIHISIFISVTSTKRNLIKLH